MAEKNKDLKQKEGGERALKGRMLDFVPVITPKGKGKA